MHTYIHAYIHTHIHAYMHTYIHRHKYIYIYIHKCYIHTYIYTYIHTHISECFSKEYYSIQGMMSLHTVCVAVIPLTAADDGSLSTSAAITERGYHCLFSSSWLCKYEVFHSYSMAQKRDYKCHVSITISFHVPL